MNRTYLSELEQHYDRDTLRRWLHALRHFRLKSPSPHAQDNDQGVDLVALVEVDDAAFLRLVELLGLDVHHHGASGRLNGCFVSLTREDGVVRIALGGGDSPRLADTITAALAGTLEEQLPREQFRFVAIDRGPYLTPDIAPRLLAEGTFVPRIPEPEDATLLQAVYADLHDDDVRLVHADALSEQGDPRGELIALQVRRYHGGPSSLERERELLEAHGRSWLGPMAPAVTRATYVRGFPERVSLSPARDVPSEAYEDHRWLTVRSIEVGNAPAAAEALLAVPPPALEELLDVPASHAPVLRRTPARLVSLGFTSNDLRLPDLEAALPRWAELAAIHPALRSVALRTVECPMGLRGFCLPHVTELRLRMGFYVIRDRPDAFAHALDEVASTKLPRLVVEESESSRLVFGRTSGAPWSDVTVELCATAAGKFPLHSLLEVLDSIPAEDVTRITLAAAPLRDDPLTRVVDLPPMESFARFRIESALERFGSLTEVVWP